MDLSSIKGRKDAVRKIARAEYGFSKTGTNDGPVWWPNGSFRYYEFGIAVMLDDGRAHACEVGLKHEDEITETLIRDLLSEVAKGLNSSKPE